VALEPDFELPPISALDDNSLRRVVATALDLPLEAVHEGLAADQCAAWDSLGQLGIAAGLHSRFGIVLSADESFRLRSMADLREIVRATRSNSRSDADASNVTAASRREEMIAPPPPIPNCCRCSITKP
jgi:acyl carrier protein